MAALAGFKASAYVSTGVSTSQSNGAMTDGGDHKTFTVVTSAQRYWDPSVAPTVQIEVDEVQTVTITGTPTGGTFTLTYAANTTSAIAYNATAATVQAALVALASIGANNVVVSGSAGGPYTVDFTGSLGFASHPLMTASGAGLTGGSSPGVAIAEVTAGATWSTKSASLYSIQYCGGVVTFNTALSTGITACRVTYNWLTVSQALQAKTVDIQTNVDLLDITTFASAGWKVKLPALQDATIKLGQWWIDVFYVSSLSNLMVLAMYSGANANQRLECYAYLKQDDIKIDVKAPVDEALDFESHGPVYLIQS